jgi:hypothetical protein
VPQAQDDTLPEDREVTVRFGGRYRPTDAPPDDGE